MHRFWWDSRCTTSLHQKNSFGRITLRLSFALPLCGVRSSTRNCNLFVNNKKTKQWTTNVVPKYRAPIVASNPNSIVNIQEKKWRMRSKKSSKPNLHAPVFTTRSNHQLHAIRPWANCWSNAGYTISFRPKNGLFPRMQHGYPELRLVSVATWRQPERIWACPPKWRQFAYVTVPVYFTRC